MDRATALRKIRACLRLAGSPNPNEAAAALRQAKALMEQYGISADEADPSGTCEAVGKTRQRGSDIHYRTWMVARTCADLFGCYVYANLHRRHSTTLRFVGIRPNPELAEYAFTVLHRQLERAVTKHVARVRKASNRQLRGATFGEAWATGLRDKLLGQLASLPAADRERFEAFAQRQAGQAIETTDAEAAKGSHRDFGAGYMAGRSATLNHGVTGSAARLLEAR